MGKGESSSSSTTQTTTTNVDKRVTTNSGPLLNLGDSSVAVNQGGQIQIVANDPKAAEAALNAMQDQGAKFLDAAAAMTKGSNDAAMKVVDSQAQFVAVATGQKYALWGILAIGGIGVLVVLPKLLKR